MNYPYSIKKPHRCKQCGSKLSICGFYRVDQNCHYVAFARSVLLSLLISRHQNDQFVAFTPRIYGLFAQNRQFLVFLLIYPVIQAVFPAFLCRFKTIILWLLILSQAAVFGGFRQNNPYVAAVSSFRGFSAVFLWHIPRFGKARSP